MYMSDKEWQNNVFFKPRPVKVHVVPTEVQLRTELFSTNRFKKFIIKVNAAMI